MKTRKKNYFFKFRSISLFVVQEFSIGITLENMNKKAHKTLSQEFSTKKKEDKKMIREFTVDVQIRTERLRSTLNNLLILLLKILVVSIG